MTRLDRLRNKREVLSRKLAECERRIEEEQKKLSRNNGRHLDARPFDPNSVEIKSPMPGKIIGVNVREGDFVRKGDTLLLLEALKMENEIVAPKDGRVTKVNVSVGDTVDAEELLVVIGL